MTLAWLVFLLSILFAVGTARSLYDDGSYYFMRVLEAGGFTEMLFSRGHAAFLFQLPLVIALKLGVRDLTQLQIAFGCGCFLAWPLLMPAYLYPYKQYEARFLDLLVPLGLLGVALIVAHRPAWLEPSRKQLVHLSAALLLAQSLWHLGAPEQWRGYLNVWQRAVDHADWIGGFDGDGLLAATGGWPTGDAIRLGNGCVQSGD